MTCKLELKNHLSNFGIDINDPLQLLSLKSLLLEPPIRIASAQLFQRFEMGAFSYLNGGHLHFARIGRYCSFAKEVRLVQPSHPIDWLSTHPFQYAGFSFVQTGSSFTYNKEIQNYVPERRVDQPKDIIVGNDVWLGHGAIILNGVQIDDGVIVGAGAVVTKDVPAFTVVAGNPARVIKQRFPEYLIEKILKIAWWQYAPWDLQGISFSKPMQALDQIEERLNAGKLKPFQPEIVDLTFIRTKIQQITSCQKEGSMAARSSVNGSILQTH